MPLASKNGKLYYKTVIVDGVEKLQLCSSCCGSEVIGCCYTYSYDNAGNPIFIVSKDTYSGCEEIQKQVDPSFDVVWYKLDDPNAECPENPPQPQPAGVCLYREDGLGSCWGYYYEGNEYPTQGFPTKEAAQEWIDSSGCADNAPDAPECAKCRCYPELIDGAPPESAWGIIQECVQYVEEYDEFGNETGNYICEKVIYLNSCTEEECQEQAEANPVADIEWRNDKPADNCRPVSSADECTESTGVFCPNVSDCNQIDLAQGCPEWGCCLFCPEQPSSLPCGCADGYVRYGNDNPCGTAGIFQPGKTCEDLGYESNRSNPLP